MAQHEPTRKINVPVGVEKLLHELQGLVGPHGRVDWHHTTRISVHGPRGRYLKYEPKQDRWVFCVAVGDRMSFIDPHRVCERGDSATRARNAVGRYTGNASRMQPLLQQLARVIVADATGEQPGEKARGEVPATPCRDTNDAIEPRPGPPHRTSVAPPAMRPHAHTVSGAALRSTASGSRLTWIHLSDIHFGHGDAEHGWDQKLVLQVLRDDLVEQCRQHRPDLLFVTGDIAFSGKPEQYQQARAWLDDTGSAIGLAPERVFAVPGNHDVDRDVDRDRDTARLLRELRAGSENLDAALAHAADREKLVARMAAYLEFSAGFGVGRLSRTPRPPQERLFWQHRESFGRLLVRVIGLNTALLAADGQDQGRLVLGKEQLARALVEPPIEPEELVIALSHHPLQGGWLADERSIVSWLRNHAHVHLFGHIHEAASEEARHGSGAGLVRVAAGAAHEEKGPPGMPAGHGYVIAKVLEDAQGGLRLCLWPRRWSLGHARFVVDVGNVPPGEVYAEHRLRLRLSGAGIASASDTSRAQGEALAGRHVLPKEIDRARPAEVIGAQEQPGASGEPLELQRDQRDRLVDLLLACDTLLERTVRDQLVVRLGNAIAPYIARHSSPRMDVSAIVGTCADRPYGIERLVEAVRWLEGESRQMHAIDDFVDRARQRS
jgi:predicted phosphodiesterase